MAQPDIDGARRRRQPRGRVLRRHRALPHRLYPPARWPSWGNKERHTGRRWALAFVGAAGVARAPPRQTRRPLATGQSSRPSGSTTTRWAARRTRPTGPARAGGARLAALDPELPDAGPRPRPGNGGLRPAGVTPCWSAASSTAGQRRGTSAPHNRWGLGAALAVPVPDGVAVGGELADTAAFAAGPATHFAPARAATRRSPGPVAHYADTDRHLCASGRGPAASAWPWPRVGR